MVWYIILTILNALGILLDFEESSDILKMLNVISAPLVLQALLVLFKNCLTIQG